MVKLTGDMGEIAQEVLDDLHSGIDVGRNIVHSTHNFRIKLEAVDNVFAHIEIDYPDLADFGEFFAEVGEIIMHLEAQLRDLEHGEIHIVRKEKSAERHGEEWVLKHIKKVKEKLEEEKDVDEEIIKDIHAALVKIKKLFLKAEHLFEIQEKETRIKELKHKLEEKEEEMKHIIEKLMQFLFTYEKIFKEFLDKLDKA